MNCRPLIPLKIEEYLKKHPEYTYGQILCSVLAIHNKKSPIKRTLLTIEDSEFYNALCISFEFEEEEALTPEDVERIEKEVELLKIQKTKQDEYQKNNG